MEGMNRDNRLWKPGNEGVQATMCLCEKCGEAYEAAYEHVCREKNSYPANTKELLQKQFGIRADVCITTPPIWHKINSYDFIADAVRTYWKKTFPQDVVVFFWQKYSFNDKWECLQEVVFCESDSDDETMRFLNDFCEGQTCVKDITIVPLTEVTDYYARTKLNY